MNVISMCYVEWHKLNKNTLCIIVYLEYHPRHILFLVLVTSQGIFKEYSVVLYVGCVHYLAVSAKRFSIIIIPSLMPWCY